MDIEAIAYQIIKEIYVYFGIPIGDASIPYIKKVGNIDIIDTEKMTAEIIEL